jgi:hypothetical protein
MAFILKNGELSEVLSGGCYSVKTKERKEEEGLAVVLMDIERSFETPTVRDGPP